MRLTQQEVKTIQQSVGEVDPNAKLILFGSRTIDEARGGDIDLLIESCVIDSKKKRDLRDQLFHRLGAQKVDLFVTKDYSEPFARVARSKGVEL